MAAWLAIAVSGCGAAGAGAPSGLDPARLAPAGSVVYLSVTVRPQGPLRTGVEAALHKLFGTRADGAIQREANRLLRRAGTSYTAGVQSWLGQRVGIVITSLGGGAAGAVRSDLALIAPTSDPAAARQFVTRVLKRSPGEAGGVIGSYAVLGGPAAFQAISAVAHGAQSLASSPTYESDLASLGSPVATVYVNLHDYVQALAGLPQMAALGSLFSHSLSRIGPGAAAVMGLSMSARQISLDFNESGVRQPAPVGTTSVGTAPAASWLALAVGGGSFSAQRLKQISQGLQLGVAAELSKVGSAPGAAARMVGQRLGFIEHTVLPALGPLSLSISGSSPLGIAAGLQLAPRDPAAAGRLLSLLHRLAAKSPSLQVSGSATNFSVRIPTGTRLNVEEKGGEVLATYGFPSASAFLHPAGTLSGNPVYQRALAQLPAGSRVPVFVNFAPIAMLVQLTDHSRNAAATLRTLNKLSYFIAGGLAGHERFVLGLS